MAASPPGWTGIHFVTSMASPKRMIQASSFLLCFNTSSGVRPPAAAGAAAVAPPEPTLPSFVTCARFCSTVPGLWIIFHSSVASWPRNAQMACSPPGWTGIHLVTSSTSPNRTIHASSFLLCLATSSKVMVGGPDGAAGAATAPPACKSFTKARSSSLDMSSGFFLGSAESAAPLAADRVMLLKMMSRNSCVGPTLPPNATVAAARPAIRPE
mmetsp:Transcript_42809/g.96673  ORF Transcript_42809/g.96673 Transcript_42809/m.96673 type:complete len:212 (-) Transcript_42809:1343-1978(-)